MQEVLALGITSSYDVGRWVVQAVRLLCMDMVGRTSYGYIFLLLGSRGKVQDPRHNKAFSSLYIYLSVFYLFVYPMRLRSVR